MLSGKFAISLHILTLLSKFPDRYLSSDFLAGSMNLHPVLVRKEIANLKKHKLVESKEGKNGGVKLLIQAKDISLDTIYKITFEKLGLGFSKNDPNPNCPVGKKINENLQLVYDNVNMKISNHLSSISLSDFDKLF